MNELFQIEEGINPIAGSDDCLLVTCASYEDRCLGVLERLSHDYRTRYGVILLSEEYADKGSTGAHLKELRDGISKKTINETVILPFKIDEPIPSMRRFSEILNIIRNDNGLNRVSVDISTIPRQELLVLLRVLVNSRPKPTIRLFYSEPRVYITEMKGVPEDQRWLTRGVRSVQSVPGFGGVRPPRNKTLLILFLGHEAERAIITWKRHQPDEVVLVMPGEHYRSDLDGIPESTHKLLLRRLGKAVDSIGRVSARGVNKARDYIFKAWEEYHRTYSILVAPYGTKLQTVGVFCAAMELSDIQVTYAVPSVYNYAHYSEGIGKIWGMFLECPRSNG